MISMKNKKQKYCPMKANLNIAKDIFHCKYPMKTKCILGNMEENVIN